MEAHFDSSLVLTFAVPKEQLQNLIPECLELDTFQDKWVARATKSTKPKKKRPIPQPRFTFLKTPSKFFGECVQQLYLCGTNTRP